MSSQPELDLARRAPPSLTARTRARAVLLARVLLFWTPVWVPLIFLGQLVALGLRPALAEEARLEQAEAEMRARVEALAREQQELGAEARMLADGVFQERVRRSLVDPTAEPLTLERARTENKP